MTKRTTLTLEDDVAARLEVEARRSGRPFRRVVNDALRAGLDDLGREAPKFRVKPVDLGLRPDIDLDDIHGLIERLEGQDRA